jgi:hypothetical protein
MKVVDGGQDLVNQPGYYWHDVVRFLDNEPIEPTYTTLVPEPHTGGLIVLAAAGLVLFGRFHRMPAAGRSS